jgi:hypothetical protein
MTIRTVVNKLKEQLKETNILLDGEAILQTLSGIDVRRKSGRGEKYDKICQTTDQARPEGYVIHSCTFLLLNSEMLSWPNSPFS